MDKYYKYEDGKYLIMEEPEIDSIVSSMQQEYFQHASHDSKTTQDLLDLILQYYTVVQTDGTTLPANDFAGRYIDLPLKLGQKWELRFNGTGFVYELVDNPDAIGTSEDNLIIYTDSVPLINNAFYKFPGGVIKVYMNGEWVDWNI